ncbi:MAG: DNA polymerase III subunit gamma/tau [Pseudomonadota bacterium]
MSYQVLARKWRPRSFGEVAGQEHVLRALINALDTGRLHHAYVFTGTRGVGKTTLARILAKCLNCERGVSSTPCGACRACTEIDEGRFLDLIEIDAASRTGVDDTRDLLDNVAYAPSVGRYKVYLIDEVHMFSRSSFNALLKTLEEPPEHVKFVLATTDPQKIPVTVLSRCLQFNLKRFPASLIVAQLTRVLEAEAVSFDVLALDTLAQAGEGSMRDAMSLLDQAIAFGNGTVTAEGVQRMLGVVDEAARFDLLEAVADEDGAAVLRIVDALDEFAPDYEALLGDLISLLHAVAIQQSVPDGANPAVADTRRLRALAERVSPEAVQLNYQIAVLGRRDMPVVPVARQAFQMTLLRMLAFRLEDGVSPTPAAAQPSTPAHAAAARAALARPAAAVAPVTTPETAPSQPGPPAPVPPPAATPPPDQLPEARTPDARTPEARTPEARMPTPTPGSDTDRQPIALTPASWPELVSRLALKGMPHQLAMHCVPTRVDGDRVALRLPEAHQHLGAERFVRRLADALESHFGQAVFIQLELGESEVASPARQLADDADARQRQAEAAIYNDPVVQQLQNRFDAEVQPDSIRPLDERQGDQ